MFAVLSSIPAAAFAKPSAPDELPPPGASDPGDPGPELPDDLPDKPDPPKKPAPPQVDPEK